MLLPQPAITIRLIRASSRGDRFIPFRIAVPISWSMRPRIAFSMVSGCSKISLSMKCG